MYGTRTQNDRSGPEVVGNGRLTHTIDRKTLGTVGDGRHTHR
jgi:hypothetical protein